MYAIGCYSITLNVICLCWVLFRIGPNTERDMPVLGAIVYQAKQGPMCPLDVAHTHTWSQHSLAIQLSRTGCT